MNDRSNHEFELPKRSLLIMSLLSVSGIHIALYLSWLHYQVHTNPSFHSFCAMNDAFNCETVAESPYSVFLGLPVSIWGVFGYALIFFLSLYGIGHLKSSAAFLAIFLASAASVLVSTLLAYVSYCIICSFCLMCSISYVINLILFAMVLYHAIHLRFSFASTATSVPQICGRNRTKLILFPLFIVTISVLYPKYWSRPQTLNGKEQISGITVDNHHWTGASNPTLEIVEFSDYICPYCRRAHAFQREIISLNPGKVRLIHRHFPLDDACNPLVETPFHDGACLMAKASICAGRQNRFWEMNDSLFSQRTSAEKLDEAAVKIGLDPEIFRRCLDSEETLQHLMNDINEGLSLGLTGTPSFVVAGKVYVGTIDHRIFEQSGIVEPRKSEGASSN